MIFLPHYTKWGTEVLLTPFIAFVHDFFFFGSSFGVDKTVPISGSGWCRLGLSLSAEWVIALGVGFEGHGGEEVGQCVVAQVGRHLSKPQQESATTKMQRTIHNHCRIGMYRNAFLNSGRNRTGAGTRFPVPAGTGPELWLCYPTFTFSEKSCEEISDITSVICSFTKAVLRIRKHIWRKKKRNSSRNWRKTFISSP